MVELNLQILDYEHHDKKQDSVYSKRLKAGKRRTYFFDVRATKGSDYYLIITESRKRFNEDGYDRHKIFLYKEDFNKFVKGLSEAVDYIKTELMPDYDFDAFNHDNAESSYTATPAAASEETESQPVKNDGTDNAATVTEKASGPDITDASDLRLASEEVDKW